MFTLKLFHRKEDGSLVTRIEACASIEAHEFSSAEYKAVELWVFDGSPNQNQTYRSYLIGDEKAQPNREDPSFRSEGWYGWALLENWEGNTTQHFRPASYG